MPDYKLTVIPDGRAGDGQPGGLEVRPDRVRLPVTPMPVPRYCGCGTMRM